MCVNRGRRLANRSEQKSPLPPRGFEATSRAGESESGGRSGDPGKAPAIEDAQDVLRVAS
jgi:hypothetical protein